MNWPRFSVMTCCLNPVRPKMHDVNSAGSQLYRFALTRKFRVCLAAYFAGTATMQEVLFDHAQLTDKEKEANRKLVVQLAIKLNARKQGCR